MTSISWNAEGGSDGTALTTANSGGASGTAWDTCQRGTNATNEFDTATAAVGSLSVLIATGATSTTAYNRWNGAITTLWASGLTTHYGRLYVRLSALPAADRTIVEFLDTTAATNRANIRIRTDGTVRLRNAANGTVATSVTTLSINTWYRLEYRIDGSTTGAYELHIYSGSSTTALEDIVGGTANFGGTIGAAGYGYVSAVASLPSIWYDGIQINDVALPGPESSGTTVAVGQATETSTSQALGRLKAKAIGQSTETGAAQAVTRLKASVIGQAAEASSAQAVNRLKTVTLGQAAETDTATALVRTTVVNLGQAAETSAAQTLGRLKTAALGQSVETSTAQAVTRLKARTLGQASEASTAQAVTSGGAQRDLEVVIGPPEAKWLLGKPEAKYLASQPE